MIESCLQGCLIRGQMIVQHGVQTTDTVLSWNSECRCEISKGRLGRWALKVFLLLREELCSHVQPATSVSLSKSMASLPFPNSIMYCIYKSSSFLSTWQVRRWQSICLFVYLVNHLHETITGWDATVKGNERRAAALGCFIYSDLISGQVHFSRPLPLCLCGVVCLFVCSFVCFSGIAFSPSLVIHLIWSWMGWSLSSPLQRKVNTSQALGQSIRSACLQ